MEKNIDLENYTSDNMTVLAHIKEKIQTDMAKSLSQTQLNPFDPQKFHQASPTKLLCIGEGKIAKKPKRKETEISKHIKSINFIRRKRKIRRKLKDVLSVKGMGIDYGMDSDY